MLNSYFLLLLIYFSLSGYSILTKVIIFKKIEKNFENLDVFYGFLFLILLTLFLNFIIPIKYISIPTIILGLILTLFFLIKKKIIFKDIRSFVLILLSIIFITHHHWPNIDTEVYHLQIINKVYHEKIIFGFANIEEKYGMNSVWQIFLSLFNIKILNTNLLYIINILPISIFFNQCFLEVKEKNCLSKSFLILCSFFILTFSLIHPTNNGIILNHIGSTEVDLLCGFLFILNVYLGIKIYYKYNENYFNLLFVLSFIIVFAKPSYLTIAFFPLIICFLLKKNPINKLNICLVFFGFLVLVRGFINSGCLIFPSKVTCYKTFWSLDSRVVQNYEYIVLGSARDNPLRLRYTDFDYVINSYDWIIPWFKNYFFTTSLLQIFFIFILLSLILLILIKQMKIKFFDKSNTWFLLFFIFCGLFWFRVPEIRFGFGWIISLSVFIPAFFLWRINFNLNSKKIIFLFTIIPFLLIIKNYENIYIFQKTLNPVYNYQFDLIYTIEDKNYVKVKNPNDRCVDIIDYCTYYNTEVDYKRILGYSFFYNSKK